MIKREFVTVVIVGYSLPRPTHRAVPLTYGCRGSLMYQGMPSINVASINSPRGKSRPVVEFTVDFGAWPGRDNPEELQKQGRFRARQVRSKGLEE